MFSLGIDIGYAAVKMALLDENALICQTRYQMHKGGGKGVVRQFIEEISESHPLFEIEYGAVTGSGAKILAGSTDILPVNEVAALVEGAGAASAEARSIIEIGGQSAKYITGLGQKDKSRVKIAMNSVARPAPGRFSRSRSPGST